MTSAVSLSSSPRFRSSSLSLTLGRLADRASSCAPSYKPAAPQYGTKDPHRRAPSRLQPRLVLVLVLVVVRADPPFARRRRGPIRLKHPLVSSVDFRAPGDAGRPARAGQLCRAERVDLEGDLRARAAEPGAGRGGACEEGGGSPGGGGGAEAGECEWRRRVQDDGCEERGGRAAAGTGALLCSDTSLPTSFETRQQG